MITLLIALGSFFLYIIAYHTYGRWLSRKIFRIDPAAPVPSTSLEDGSDFVPTPRTVLFGHHFTSIAGTGPIVGPALAVIWGWLPALLWVIFGSIFIGAVHDLGALIVSMRNRGQTVGDIAGRVLTPRARILFLSVLFMALTIVLAIFGLVIAGVFATYPSAIIPCLIQIPLAVVIGMWLHRRGAGLLIPSLITLALMYVSIAFGNWGPLGQLNQAMAAWPLLLWVSFLLIYSYIASILPVWTLLQPRDYINSLQLLSALGLVLVGVFVTAFIGVDRDGIHQPLEIVAPAINASPEGAPWLFPFLFITIACGAISGFHCLVSSGTSSKQIRSEGDAQFVGYGAMLTEGFLAILVILACTAGIGLGVKGTDGVGFLMGEAAYDARYTNWSAATSLGVSAFVEGAANFIQSLGISPGFAIALMGVFVASFAATTLDTACRLQRYVVQELAATLNVKPLTNKHAATLLAISLAFLVAYIPAPGKVPGSGGLNLWPLFGATNQLLAGLSFLVILFWMWRRNLPLWFVAIPAAIMLVVPGTALMIGIFQTGGWLDQSQFALVTIGLLTLALEIWIIIEACLAWPKARGLLETQLPPLPSARTPSSPSNSVI